MAEKLGSVEEALRTINAAIASAGSGAELIDQQIEQGTKSKLGLFR